MRSITPLSLLLLLVGLAACGPQAPERPLADDDDDDYDPGEFCAGVLSADPDVAATDVFVQRVSVTWEEVPLAGGVALQAPGGDEVAGAMSEADDGRTLIFTPDSPLLTDSTYDVTITQDCSQDITYQFTTGPWGAPVQDEDELIGRVFHVDLAGASWVQPAGFGPMLPGLFVNDYLLIEATADSDLSAGVMHVLGAVGALDGFDIVQNTRFETLPLTQGADGVAGTGDDEPAGWNNPTMNLQSSELVLNIQGAEAEIQDLSISATFRPDLSGFEGGTFGGTIDTRGFMELMDSEDPNGFCELLEEVYGVACEDCGDGGIFCMVVLAEDVTGTWLSNLPGGLTPVP